MAETQLNAGISIADNLKAATGKYVVIEMCGGTIKGFIKDVNNGLLHLEKVAERDYFDALIRVDSIAAVELQVRGLKS